jgi:hypothetical protein
MGAPTRMFTNPASRSTARWCETVGWVTLNCPTISVTDNHRQLQIFMIFCRVPSARIFANTIELNSAIAITLCAISHRQLPVDRP